MKKIIIVLIVIGLLLCYLFSKTEHKTQYVHKPLVEAQITPKSAPSKVLTKNTSITYIAKKVSLKTGISQKTITKIILAESGGNPNAIHYNKNGTKDYGLFQVNSIHLKEAKQMSLNLLDPDDNAVFAIYLIRHNGLRDWKASMREWSV